MNKTTSFLLSICSLVLSFALLAYGIYGIYLTHKFQTPYILNYAHATTVQFNTEDTTDDALATAIMTSINPYLTNYPYYSIAKYNARLTVSKQRQTLSYLIPVTNPEALKVELKQGLIRNIADLPNQPPKVKIQHGLHFIADIFSVPTFDEDRITLALYGIIPFLFILSQISFWYFKKVFHSS